MGYEIVINKFRNPSIETMESDPYKPSRLLF